VTLKTGRAFSHSPADSLPSLKTKSHYNYTILYYGKQGFILFLYYTCDMKDLFERLISDTVYFMSRICVFGLSMIIIVFIPKKVVDYYEWEIATGVVVFPIIILCLISYFLVRSNIFKGK
jgi:hypothetical protein